MKVATVDPMSDKYVLITARWKASPSARMALKLGQYTQSRMVPSMARVSDGEVDPSAGCEAGCARLDLRVSTMEAERPK